MPNPWLNEHKSMVAMNYFLNIRDLVYIHLSRNVTNPIILQIWFIYICQETLPSLLYYKYGLYTFVKKRYLPYYIRDMVYIHLSGNVNYPIILEIWFIYICQETLPTLLY